MAGAGGANGAPYATLTRARVQSVSWKLNTWGECKFVMTVSDPQLEHIKVLERELQVWREGILIWWGVILKMDQDHATITVTCVGLLWYYSRRFFGPPTLQYLTNGGFEDGITGWTATGLSGGATVIAGGNRARGQQAVRLVQNNVAANGYIAQTLNFVSSSPAGGFHELVLSAWADVETFTGPAFEERGLYISGSATGYFQEEWTPLNYATPSGWQRYELAIQPPTGLTTAIAVRGMGVQGTTVWDEFNLRQWGGVGSVDPVDWATILTNIATYAVTGPHKSTLNMGLNLPATGLLDSMLYGEADHANIYEAMVDLPRRRILDIDVEWAIDGLSRTLRSYAPQKGTAKNVPLIWGENIQGFKYAVDGEKVATVERMLGRGEGVNREFSVKVNTSNPNMPALERVDTAPQEMTLTGMDEAAQHLLDCFSDPGSTPPSLVVKASAILGQAWPGDSVPITIQRGKLQYNAASRRILSLELAPRHGEGAELVSVGLESP